MSDRFRALRMRHLLLERLTGYFLIREAVKVEKKCDNYCNFLMFKAFLTFQGEKIFFRIFFFFYGFPKVKSAFDD